MAKTTYVTRTINSHKVVVLQMNPNEGEPYNAEYDYRQKVKDKKKVLKNLREKYEDSDNLVICSIVGIMPTKKMVGCPEEIFNKYAVELDLKTRRPKYPEPFADKVEDLDVEEAEVVEEVECEK